METKEISTNRSGGNLFHAYLFISQNQLSVQKEIDKLIGESGCIKEDISVIQPGDGLDKTGEISVELVRQFIHQVSLSSHGGNRIGIIYQVDRLNNSSSNILLKTLEEPPKNVIIVLTANSSNIISTIKSRCRIIRINDKPEVKSITYSYHDFIGIPLFRSFKRIEEIVKDNKVGELLTDWTNEFENKLLKDYSVESAAILEKIVKIKRKIAGNANPRLLLENLVLFMRKKSYER